MEIVYVSFLQINLNSYINYCYIQANIWFVSSFPTYEVWKGGKNLTMRKIIDYFCLFWNGFHRNITSNIYISVEAWCSGGQINDLKSPEKFISDNEIVEKSLIWGVSTNFCKNVPFWGPYIGSKYFSYLPLNLSRRRDFAYKDLSYQKQQKLEP